MQPLGRATSATHAAVLADTQGAILLVREDIGWHNAMDKLIGAAASASMDLAATVCLITSRCSFEMVQKAVAGRIGILVALSVPTTLTVRLADTAGLTLIGHAPSPEPLAFSGAHLARPPAT
jgi:FdhD protein